MATDKYSFPDIYLEKQPKESDDDFLTRQLASDTLYAAVRKILLDQYLRTSKTASDNIPIEPKDFVDGWQREINDERRLLLVVFGLLSLDGKNDPTMGRQRGQAGPSDIVIDDLSQLPERVRNSLNPPPTDSVNGPTVIISTGRPGASSPSPTVLPPQPTLFIIAPLFAQAVVPAVREYNSSKDLFDAVFPLIAGFATQSSAGNAAPVTTYTVIARQYAGVSRRLSYEGADAGDKQLKVRVGAQLSIALGDGIEASASAIDIQLPDLEAGSTVDIVADNVKALAAIYFASQLEELKLFAVADRVVEHFMSGMLPISRGTGGNNIYAYLRAAPQRFTAAERLSFYERAFGFALGTGDLGTPNRDFTDLFTRFAAHVNMYNRQSVYQKTIVTGQQAVKAARDLAVNLSLHGYGIAHFAAVELQKLANTVIEMLSHPDVVQAYAARDVWQLVERVSTLYLGGPANGVRFRATARSGSRIMLWLAAKAPLLASTASDSVDPDNLFALDAVDKLTNINVSHEVDRWVAVTATVEQTVEKFSEPTDQATQPTIPTMTQSSIVPDALKGMLGSIGNLTGAIGTPAMPISAKN